MIQGEIYFAGVFRKRLALNQFRTEVDEAFGFLVHEFGFRIERVPRPSNEFSVRFVNDTTRILVEGIHWGGSARVAFGHAGPIDQFDNFDLLDFAAIRCPDRVPAAGQPPPGQSPELKMLAGILRECGAAVRHGGFSTAAQIHELRRRRQEEWDEQERQRGRPRPPRPET